ncbi:MAG: sulfite exporter TauE/SafE family protein [Opitutaceae bacterium]
MTLFDYGSVLLLGLLGSGHCLGMCGGFALAVAAPARSWPGVLGRHLAYQAGKALTYVFLAIVVATGTGLLSRLSWFSGIQVGLAVVVGLIMILLGLAQVFEFRLQTWWTRWVEPTAACRALGRLTGSSSLVSAFVIGWLNGFLPCGLVLAALFYLASFRSVVDAALGAVVFGLGTFPSLFLLGAFSRTVGLKARRRLLRWAGLLIIAFGVVTLVRWVPAVHHWFHQTLIPASAHLIEWCLPG